MSTSKWVTFAFGAVGWQKSTDRNGNSRVRVAFTDRFGNVRRKSEQVPSDSDSQSHAENLARQLVAEWNGASVAESLTPVTLPDGGWGWLFQYAAPI